MAAVANYEVADICLGNPPLKCLSVFATIADALSVLKSSKNNWISIWSCDHYSTKTTKFEEEEEKAANCICVGKICMVDIICYLCKDENLHSPSFALKSPVSALLSKLPARLITHVEPTFSIVEAIDIFLQGAQNLVIPMKNRIHGSLKQKPLQISTITQTVHNGREFCWLTQEDVIRFLLNSIGMFFPVAAMSIEKLGLIKTDILAVQYYSPASDAVDAISKAKEDQTSVAVIDSDGILIGEISPYTLSCCDESVVGAITTLSTGDLMSYIDCGGPPEEIVNVVTSRLKERNLETMLYELVINNSPNIVSSSDEEYSLLSSPASTALSRCHKHSRSSSYSARMVRRAEAIVCHRHSSLVAVMIQASAHRVNYVWVIEEDGSVVGMVSFPSMLAVFHQQLDSID